MPSNILYKDEQMLQKNDAVYGTAKVRYVPWINRIVGSETNHSNGQLGEMSIKEIGYDLTQQFPTSKLAAVIKATSTEFAQATANAREFEYHKTVLAVEFKISNLKNANMTNVEAGILNELNKQYDVEGYNGSLGNVGINGNPNKVDGAEVLTTTPEELIQAISAGKKLMKKSLQITDGDFTNVMMGYPSGVADILDKVVLNVTGRKVVTDTFPDLDMDEIPSFITGSSEYIEFYYKPMLRLHHGAAPSLYNTEDGPHGLSKSELFTYESVGIEGEAKGAIVRIPVKFA